MQEHVLVLYAWTVSLYIPNSDKNENVFENDMVGVKWGNSNLATFSHNKNVMNAWTLSENSFSIRF